MGRSSHRNVVAGTAAINRAPTDAGRGSLIKAGLAASIFELWQSEPIWAVENEMSNDNKHNNKHNSLPSILKMADVQAVSPALAHYTEDSLLNGLWKRLNFLRAIAVLSRWLR